MGGGIFLVIYVDVLFVVNFFITYLLLLVTSLISKTEAAQLRLLFASTVGGLYSLVIICDKLNFLMSLFGKFGVSILLVFIAFSFRRFSIFIKNFLIFLFANMLFFGIISVVYIYLKPQGMAIKNGSVYFNISAKLLLFCAFLAYIITFIIIKICNRTLSKNEIYNLTVIKDNVSYHFFALCDSGNKLKEPFSDYPVIIVDKSKMSIECERVIPCQTVSGEGILKAFKPDKIILSNGKRKTEINKVYIALCDIDSKSYSAVIPNDLTDL